MKVLLENNFYQFNTRPLYLRQAIDSIDGYNASIRNINMSFYDALDDQKPDVYIIDAHMINSEILQYFFENKDITIAINISDIADKHIQQLDTIINEEKINCKFLISNKFNHSDKHIKTKTPIYKLMECYDNMLDDSGELNIQRANFEYPRYVYIDDMHGKYMQPNKDCEIFHVISCMPKPNSEIDLSINAMLVSQLIKNYDEGVFYISDNIPQAFFHSIMHNKKTSIYTNDSNKESVKDVFKKIFSLDDEQSFFYDSNTLDQESIKAQIIEKHTPLNRAKRLLSQLN